MYIYIYACIHACMYIFLKILAAAASFSKMTYKRETFFFPITLFPNAMQNHWFWDPERLHV